MRSMKHERIFGQDLIRNHPDIIYALLYSRLLAVGKFDPRLEIFDLVAESAGLLVRCVVSRCVYDLLLKTCILEATTKSSPRLEMLW